MTSRLELHHRYDADPGRVRAMLADPEYLQAKLDAVGGPGAELLGCVQTDDGGAAISIRQGVPSDKLPQLVRSLLPGDLIIERAEVWDAGGRGTVSASVDGAPGEINGTLELSREGDGTVLTILMDAEVGVPLIGGRIEKAITENIGQLMDVEHRFAVRWLAEHQA